MADKYRIKLSDGRQFDVESEGGPPSEADIMASLGAAKGQEAKLEENAAPRSNVGLGMVAAGKGIPAAATGAMELATNPAVPQMAATAGRVAGAIAPVVKYGPVGLLGSAKGSWAGGKAGWFTGKLAQNVAAPVAGALEKAAPYAKTLSQIGGVQGALDLAQMAEPDRRDIGTLGVAAPSAKWMTQPVPPADELAKMPVDDAVKTLTDIGWPDARAKSYVTQMRKLMNR